MSIYYETLPYILEQIEKLKPKAVLEIGIGLGTYGVLLREKLDFSAGRLSNDTWTCRIDGIEPNSEYNNGLHKSIYNNVFYGNVHEIINKLNIYDIIIISNTLEYMDKSSAKLLLNELLNHVNKSVLVSIPQYTVDKTDIFSKQKDIKSAWAITDFIEYDYSYMQVKAINNIIDVFHIFPIKKDGKNYKMDNLEISELPADKPLNIGYILPHHNLTGGMKMLLEQMRHLRKRGNKIIAIFKGDNANSAIPDWFKLEVDEDIVVPTNGKLSKYANKCDVILSGGMEPIVELENSGVPLVYWEQGHELIFGDFNDLSYDSEVRKKLEIYYSTNCHITTVSPVLSQILEKRYNRNTFVIPNGIDTDFYYPGEKPNDNTILLIGNPKLRFKGFDIALAALQGLLERGVKFKVKWICQNRPDIGNLSFPIEYIVKPPQEELARQIRTSDLFIFTSWYEGFGMPPLEAMASGVPVITTACGGIDSFIKSGNNAVVVNPGMSEQITVAAMKLLQNKALRDVLSERGRDTALKFRFSEVVKILENYFRNVIAANQG